MGCVLDLAKSLVLAHDVHLSPYSAAASKRPEADQRIVLFALPRASCVMKQTRDEQFLLLGFPPGSRPQRSWGCR